MREIKFRAWNSSIKRMFGEADIYEIGDCRKKERFGGYFDKNKVIFLQFTGLQDVTGKDIYEGDILEFDEKEWGCKHILEVKYDKYSGFAGSGTLRDWEIFCKVLGNIYENPELLEQGRCG